jgi:hypothetical protein
MRNEELASSLANHVTTKRPEFGLPNPSAAILGGYI